MQSITKVVKTYYLNFNMSTSSKLDTTLLIHVGVELVVVGGVTFWLNRKIGKVNEEVQELRKKCEEYEKVLGYHDSIIRQLVGGPPPRQREERPPQQVSRQSPSQQNPSQVSLQTSRPPPQEVEEEEEEDNYNPEEIDGLLEDEINSIKAGRDSEKLSSEEEKKD